MNQAELDEWRTTIRVTLLYELVSRLYIVLAKTTPEIKQSVVAMLDEMTESPQPFIMKGTPPEVSGLVTLEYQEALQQYTELIKSKIAE